MCGRYYLMKRINDVLEDMQLDVIRYLSTKEDCRPQQYLPVIVEDNGQLKIKKLKWGYTTNYSSQVLINARSETILEKKMFKEDIFKRRCLILANGFYEWDAHQHQIAFEPKDKVLFMAGIYNRNGEFVIITKNANEIMKPVHSRMPVMISKEDISSWFDSSHFPKYLQSEVPFDIVSGILQTSLF